MNTRRKRVVVAMSGGVDSSVAAAILKNEGHDVMGVTMKLWTEDKDSITPSQSYSCYAERTEAARQSCQILDIPFSVFNCEHEFLTHVVDPFCQEYLAGRTPNPCIDCNRKIKFGLLLDHALALGADYLATGHYARIEKSNGSYRLLKSNDLSKDQSYVLYALGQRELEHLLFPLGYYHKLQTRTLARQKGLPAWDKEESQEVCFIPGNDYRSFLSKRIPSKPGDIIDTDGNLIGRHPGISCFTVGQRRGLGLASKEPLYVLSINTASNQLVVGPRERLLKNELFAGKVSFIQGKPPPRLPASITAKVRYRSQEAKAMLNVKGQNAQLRFEEPQLAITLGQAVVFYSNDNVLGGGIIEQA